MNSGIPSRRRRGRRTHWHRVAVVGLFLLSACSHVSQPVEHPFSIRIQHVELSEQKGFSATLTFMNELGREVSIVNAGCGFPDFLLEHFTDGSWRSVGGPVCVALAIAPTTLGSGDTYSTTVSMYIDSTLNGLYRLKFDIREKGMTEKIPLQYLVSHQFIIE